LHEHVLYRLRDFLWSGRRHGILPGAEGKEPGQDHRILATVHYNLENALECYLEFIPSAESRNYTLGILLFVAAGVGLVTAILTSL
jgi:hypothetical protein